ncbi:hypothetical protein EVAR_52977_1 [Eumeta japonica]|uniref:Uncharacterized protein n=1 Tax=Eumeta variegata TaxID=151549 RepID=A0A4C1Z6P4_EUMVA|nr:hypothetical protein EVAR_52977_1 [Eumeta japonica]
MIRYDRIGRGRAPKADNKPTLNFARALGFCAPAREHLRQSHNSYCFKTSIRVGPQLYYSLAAGPGRYRRIVDNPGYQLPTIEEILWYHRGSKTPPGFCMISRLIGGLDSNGYVVGLFSWDSLKKKFSQERRCKLKLDEEHRLYHFFPITSHLVEVEGLVSLRLSVYPRTQAKRSGTRGRMWDAWVSQYYAVAKGRHYGRVFDLGECQGEADYQVAFGEMLSFYHSDVGDSAYMVGDGILSWWSVCRYR